MPTPKISGLLNNCSLYSALPILLEGIDALSTLEKNGQLQPLELANNTIIESYTRLKGLFALHYQIEPDMLSWTQFNDFLKSNSFYANEIIFSPVFRSFIAALGPTNGYASEDLWLLRDIQNTEYSPGRYNPLDATEASPLFYAPFGISLALYEYNTTNNDYIMSNSRPCRPTDYPFGSAPTLKLYIRAGDHEEHAGHFELQPHETLADATQAFIDEVNLLPEELGAIHDGLSSSQRAHDTNKYLGLLVTYVRKTLLSQLASNRPQFIDAQTYAVNGLSLHNPTPSGRQTFALILLIILFENGSAQAQSFVDKMSGLSDRNLDEVAKGLLDELSRNIIESKANLEDRRVITISNQIEAYQLKVSEALQKNTALSAAPIEARLNAALTNLVAEASESNHPDANQVIQGANNLITGPINPQAVAAFQTLQKKGGWGKTIAGLMLTVIGLAMMLVASLGFAGTLGIPTPASAAIFAGGAYTTYQGIRFFNAGRGCGDADIPKTNAPAMHSPTA